MMKPFPLRFLEYDPLTKIVFGMDICDTVSLAMMSPEIREMIKVRDLEDVKMNANYTVGKCVIEVQYKDGTSSNMLLFECKTFPTSTSASYNIGGYQFKIGKTTNNCVIYTGEHINEASVMLMEHLLIIFKSSRVHLDVKNFPVNSLRRMLTCEAFNYVHLRTIEGFTEGVHSFPLFESVFLGESTFAQKRQLLPEHRPVVSENRFRAASVEAWMEDFHARKCPKIETELRMVRNTFSLIKRAMVSWQRGTAPSFQNLMFITHTNENSGQFPYVMSITDGLENLTCWDSIGRREAFNRITQKHLLLGYDLTVTDDLRASYIAYKSSNGLESKLFLEFVFWRPANVA